MGVFMKKRILELVMGVLLLVGALTLTNPKVITVFQEKISDEKKTVIIDAGHGGNDPGKVGVNQAKEKDINLKIALKLKAILEQEDIKVIMIREEDRGLYDESSSNKKSQDMKRRVELINKEQPDCVISIHQNSYHQADVSGAQTFFYETSNGSKKLAELIQAELIKKVDPGNHRVAKANTSYYMLKMTKVPIAIVECGFLSNWEEAELLVNDEYQNKLAWAIHMAVMEYLNGK